MSVFPTKLKDGQYLFSFGSGDGVAWGSQSLYTGVNGQLGYQATATTYSSSIAPDLISSIDSPKLTLNQWNHVAVTRAGHTYSVYVNGTRVITTTNSSAPAAVNPSYIMFGNAHAGGPNWPGGATGKFPRTSFIGYMDNIRITKGVARYTGATTTVPTFPFGTTVATDPHWNSVSMLLDMEASKVDTINSTPGVPYDQYHATAFDGLRARNRNQILITNNGAAGTGYNPVNTYFPLSGVDGAYGTGDFTWELRFYLYVKNPGYHTFLSTRRDDGASSSGIVFGENNGVPYVFTDKFLIQAGMLSESFQTSSSNHIALVRRNGVFTLYVNGSSVGSYSSSVYNLTEPDIYVGGNADGSQGNTTGLDQFTNIRITQGALYTGNFTPPF